MNNGFIFEYFDLERRENIETLKRFLSDAALGNANRPSQRTTDLFFVCRVRTATMPTNNRFIFEYFDLERRDFE